MVKEKFGRKIYFNVPNPKSHAQSGLDGLSVVKAIFQFSDLWFQHYRAFSLKATYGTKCDQGKFKKVASYHRFCSLRSDHKQFQSLLGSKRCHLPRGKVCSWCHAVALKKYTRLKISIVDKLLETCNLSTIVGTYSQSPNICIHFSVQ